MMIYGISCGASALIAYLGSKTLRGKAHRKEVLFFSCLPLFLVAAFRYNVGEDYLDGYVRYFETLQLNMLPQNRQMELVFHLLNICVAKLGGGYEFIFIICAFLFYFLIIDQILLDSPAPAMSIFLLTGMGYVFISFNAMRQMVGCAILLWSLRYVSQRRFLLFAVCVAIAGGFHLTCLFFLIVYWWSRIKITPTAALMLTGIILIFSRLITQLIITLASKTYYAIYLSSTFATGKTAWITIAIHVLLLIFYSLLYKKDDSKMQMYYNLLLAALWVSFFSGSVVLSNRLMWMFSLSTIISLPMVIESIKDKTNAGFVKAGVVLFYTAYALITVGLLNSNSVLPYQTVLLRWL